MKTKQRFAWRWVALLVVGALLLAGCDWPMFRYGPEHTGFISGEKKINVGNVASLRTRFAAREAVAFASPAVANGILYIPGDTDFSAFDATGTTGCAGTPRTCSPLWTYQGNFDYGTADSSPAVANGFVYIGFADGTLVAYDANGKTGCSGTPKVCSPLWVAPLEAGGEVSSPTVANGIVYVTATRGELAAFDANGVTGCSGTSKTCSPLWTAGTGTISTSPAVANGVVYVSDDRFLNAFDANGVTGCSRTPKFCSPLWTAPLESSSAADVSTPAVANGRVYLTSAGVLQAFDANGVTGCSGIPKTCSVLWTSAFIGTYASSPAVANGVVYVGGGTSREILAFSVSGALLWSATTGDWVRSSPTVANGVVYIGSNDSHLYAFDASGTTACSAGTCTPLWSATTGRTILSSPTVANGLVYVGSLDGKLYAYGLP